MTATIIDFQEARSRMRGMPSGSVLQSPDEAVDYDAAVQAAWAMLDNGEVGAHEFLELCREAMAEG